MMTWVLSTRVSALIDLLFSYSVAALHLQPMHGAFFTGLGSMLHILCGNVVIRHYSTGRGPHQA
jgi:hypothetical protein